MRRSCAACGPLLCALALLAGCGHAPDPAASRRPCDEGETVACTCAHGRGVALCLAGDKRTPCVCTDERPASTLTCGAAGDQSACRCDDGRAGEHTCLAEGRYSQCRCGTPDRAIVADAGSALDAAMPAVEPTPAERCCHDLGTCVPRAQIPAADRERLGRDDCSDVELACVPDAFAQSGGPNLQPCRSLGGSEGRCVPDCLPGVAAQRDVLPEDLCAAHERCVPCFDPISGAANGVCGLGRDDGPKEAPLLFGRCCDEAGQCLPTALVPETERSRLATDACDSGRGLVCVPDAVAAAREHGLAECRAFGTAEGRCVPTCLPGAPAGSPWLAQGACATGELCVPCTDPLSGGATAACSVGGDEGPREPAFVFASCCEVDGQHFGRCIPRALLPPDAAAGLRSLECASPDQACVPLSRIADPSAGFAHCQTTSAAGACVPRCMVDPQLSPMLMQAACAASELCVPCQLNGNATGVCKGT